MTRRGGGALRATVRSRERLLAQLYDWGHDEFVDDLHLYVALAKRTAGGALELACGSGRVLAALAQAGLDVVGLDCSQIMLERASARLSHLGNRVTLVRGDLNGELPDGRFGLIVLGLDAFGLAPDLDRQRALVRRLAHALDSQGVVVFDLVNTGALDDQPQGVPLLQRTGYCQEVGAQVTKWIVRRVSASTQTIQLSCFYDLVWDDGTYRREVDVLSLRYYSRYEVELLIVAGGLRLESVYGDYELGPLRDDSERLIVIASGAS